MIQRLHAWFLPQNVSDDIRDRSRANLLVGTILAYLAIGGVTVAVFFVATDAPDYGALTLRYGSIATVFCAFSLVLMLFRRTGRRVLCANLLAGFTGGMAGPLPMLFMLVPARTTRPHVWGVMNSLFSWTASTRWK